MSPPSYPSAWLRPRRARFRFTRRSHFSGIAEPLKPQSRRLQPAKLPLPTSFFQLAIASRVDLGLSSGEPILGRHIADRAVQSHRVVVIHVDLNQAARIFQRQRGQGPARNPVSPYS